MALHRIKTSAAKRLEENPELDQFALDGVHLDGSPWSETFTVLPILGVRALEVIAGLVDTIGPEGTTRLDASTTRAIAEFFEAVLVPEDAERFAELVDDPARLVDAADLANAARWVQEVIGGGRPTDGPASSEAGRSDTSSTSGGSSSWVGTRPLPSLPSRPATSSTSP